MRYLIYLTSLFLFSLSLSATDSEYFSKKGEIAHFDYNPKSYDLRHSINYYLPNSYKKTRELSKVLFLLHGGGASTASYESSKRVAQMYMEDFTDYAEENNIIIVAPGSSVGWSFITRVLVNEIVDLMKIKLKVDTNKFLLFGHSMGGMGITREAHWVVDHFNGLMPTAAGMQECRKATEKKIII